MLNTILQSLAVATTITALNCAGTANADEPEQDDLHSGNDARIATLMDSIYQELFDLDWLGEEASFLVDRTIDTPGVAQALNDRHMPFLLQVGSVHGVEARDVPDLNAPILTSGLLARAALVHNDRVVLVDGWAIQWRDAEDEDHWHVRFAPIRRALDGHSTWLDDPLASIHNIMNLAKTEMQQVIDDARIWFPDDLLASEHSDSNDPPPTIIAYCKNLYLNDLEDCLVACNESVNHCQQEIGTALVQLQHDYDDCVIESAARVLVCSFRCMKYPYQPQLMQCLDACVRDHQHELLFCLDIHDQVRAKERQLAQCTLDALNALRNCVAHAKAQFRDCLTQGTQPAP